MLVGEIGHPYRQVENKGFRALHALLPTKRAFTHDDHSFLAALLIFMGAFNLTYLFASQIERR